MNSVCTVNLVPATLFSFIKSFINIADRFMYILIIFEFSNTYTDRNRLFQLKRVLFYRMSKVFSHNSNLFYRSVRKNNDKFFTAPSPNHIGLTESRFKNMSE